MNPIFSPGGNIGDLAVNGTVNDLAMCGAKPLFLSAGFILEEGFEIEKLLRTVESMKTAAKVADVMLVTCDTKVVENGDADGVFINTSGIGVISEGVYISPRNAVKGDVVIINGNIADYGVAILSHREGLDFESEIISDTALLNHLVAHMLEMSKDVHVLRDPTRGGIAAALNEIAESSNVGIRIQEDKILISRQVRSISSLLGIDPLMIANEGKVLAFVKEESALKILDVMHQHPEGRNVAIIGRVVSDHAGKVVMETSIGTKRLVDMPIGENLPRIC